jgi:hypothetical protein
MSHTHNQVSPVMHAYMHKCIHTYITYVHTHTHTHTHKEAGDCLQQCGRQQTGQAAINPLTWQEFILASASGRALWSSRPPVHWVSMDHSLGTVQPPHEPGH